MDYELSQLPWDELQRVEGGIPWPALRTLADAVAADPRVIPELFKVYDQAYEQAPRQPTWADLYVPVIFALAAPKLDDKRRREIGALLIDRLVQAGRDDADVSMEVLQAALGTMGPVVLPTVLDAIAKEPDAGGAWFPLWGLTVLAAQTEDETIRNQVIRACADLLERADREEADPTAAPLAAWTLAALQRTEYTDLVQRLTRKPIDRFWSGEYQTALELLQGSRDYTPVPELWEQPVEEWLTSRRRNVGENIQAAEHPAETQKQSPAAGAAELLADGFVHSPIAATLPPQLGQNAHLIAQRLFYFSLTDLETPPARWDEPSLRELLLDVVPRRLPADRTLLEKIIPITEALLYWLHFEGMLTDGDALAQTIHGWTDQLIAAGLDPHNWGATKAALMKALDAGLDFNDPQVRKAVVDQSVAEALEGIPQPESSPNAEPPIPIVERSSAPARNAPCPCGSGKKYKKCHGRPGTEQTTPR
jgi:hypothetical protein